jgi:glucose 1-dehydrogenase
MDKKRFHDKVAVITGAARGIGFACAERFISEGARVVLVDIDDKGIEAARKLGSKAIFFKCDVSERAHVENAIGNLPKTHANIDILVNNAAASYRSDILTLTEDDFLLALKVNLLGAFHFTQLCARQMMQRTREGESAGAIVNIASINSLLAMPEAVAYCASKGALLQLTRASALALAPYGIRVNAVGPGSVATEGNTESLDRVSNRTPLGRFGTPEEIAGVVAFLASPDAAYITGEIIYVDGGRLVLNYTMR